MRAVCYDHARARNLLDRTLGAFHLTRRGEQWDHFGVRTVKDPRLPGPEWLIVDVELAAIDPAEVEALPQRLAAGRYAAARYHEACVPGGGVVGVVREAGAQVGAYRQGDRVLVDPIAHCVSRGKAVACPMCKSALYHLCAWADTDLQPGRTGGWAEQVVAHRTLVQKLPERVTAHCAVLVDALANALHAALKLRGQAEKIVVIGAGVAGLAQVAMLRALGQTGRLVVVGAHAHAAEWAYDAGADFVVRDRPDQADMLALAAPALGAAARLCPPAGAILKGGADIVFETTGTDSALTLACRLAREAGTVVMAAHRHLDRIDWTPFFLRELTLKSAHGHTAEYLGGKLTHAYSVALDFIARGVVQPRPWLSHRFSFDEYEHALAVATDSERYQALGVAFSPTR